MSALTDILRAAIERAQQLNANQLQHIKEQGEALAENARKPLWQIRMENINAMLTPIKPSEPAEAATDAPND